MRRMIWLLVVGWLASAGAARAAAFEPPPLDPAITPAGRLVVSGAVLMHWLAAARGDDGSAPRLSDPRAAPYIRAAFSQEALATIDPADLALVMDACVGAANVLAQYMLFGSDVDPANAGPDQMAELDAQARANQIKFQDEAGLAMAFNLECGALQIAALERLVARAPSGPVTGKLKTGLDGMREQVWRTLFAAVRAQTEGLSAANKARILETLSRRAAVLVTLLDPERRQVFTEYVAEVASEPGDGQARLKALEASVRAVLCERLCMA